jgi:hypothetical protein
MTTAWDAGYVHASVIMPETTKPTPIGKSIGNKSCISFVKWKFGITNSWWTPQYVWNHYADLGLQKIEIEKNSIIILKEGYVWHVAVVIDYDDENIFLQEQNYSGPYITTRTIPRTYGKIIGFLQVR